MVFGVLSHKTSQNKTMSTAYVSQIGHAFRKKKPGVDLIGQDFPHDTAMKFRPFLKGTTVSDGYVHVFSIPHAKEYI